jgi:hypothetical protein
MKNNGVLEYWSSGGMSTEKDQSQAQTESPLPLSALCPNRRYLAEICIEREDGRFIDYRNCSEKWLWITPQLFIGGQLSELRITGGKWVTPRFSGGASAPSSVTANARQQPRAAIFQLLS